jgi:hypothetical protein
LRFKPTLFFEKTDWYFAGSGVFAYIFISFVEFSRVGEKKTKRKRNG